ncbi:MAG: hypothetical protein R3Y67_07305, partial [Eubacteriales bacterium]
MSNNHEEFSNSIQNKYRDFGQSYAPAAMLFLSEEQEGEQALHTTHYHTQIHKIQYLKAVNEIYNSNMTFLLQVMNQRVLEQTEKTTEKQIQTYMKTQLPAVKEEAIHHFVERMYTEIAPYYYTKELQTIVEQRVNQYLSNQHIEEKNQLKIARTIVNMITSNPLPSSTGVGKEEETNTYTTIYHTTQNWEKQWQKSMEREQLPLGNHIETTQGTESILVESLGIMEQSTQMEHPTQVIQPTKIEQSTQIEQPTKVEQSTQIEQPTKVEQFVTLDSTTIQSKSVNVEESLLSNHTTQVVSHTNLVDGIQMGPLPQVTQVSKPSESIHLNHRVDMTHMTQVEQPAQIVEVTNKVTPSPKEIRESNRVVPSPNHVEPISRIEPTSKIESIQTIEPTSKIESIQTI